jgi:SOS response regulatory protein OraA/RecX
MQEDFTRALAKALKKLETSDQFESEVRRALHEFAPETTDDVVRHLAAKGILNDERMAQRWVETKSGRRADGRQKLVATLERRGVPAEMIEQALPDPEAERQRLRDLLHLKFKPGDSPAKAGRFLYSRGFCAEDIEAECEIFFGESA